MFFIQNHISHKCEPRSTQINEVGRHYIIEYLMPYELLRQGLILHIRYGDYQLKFSIALFYFFDSENPTW